MKGLLPLKSRVEPTNEGANVVSISEDAADEVFKTLSSSTARQILAALYEEPRPASELGTETDTTVQNVRYHLQNLQDAE
ncbi:MAG: helix-turn-helix domain-containing protein, partial [Halohasta sp.]